uniref:Ribonuclease A-domain domain-containing protein n=1 Tax=Salarias fasciatus TaxID=181472 RepID=A0A672GBT8_SALFA
MKIQLACFLLLFTSVLSQPPAIRERYEKFISQHINTGMSVNRCDQVIGQKGIRTVDGMCKETNTFILANTGRVKPVCGWAGQPRGLLTESQNLFPLIVCELRNQGSRPPRCQYRGRALTRRIVIACEQGYPVHYDQDIFVFRVNKS